MIRNLIIPIILLISFQGKAQRQFIFEPDLYHKAPHENLIRLLPKSTILNSDFQVRLWYAIRAWDLNILESNLGLLLIMVKNGKLSSQNFHFLHIKTKSENGYFITEANLERKKSHTSNINMDFKKLLDDGLLTCKTMNRWDRKREKLAIKRGFNAAKGFLKFYDGTGFTIELINKSGKKRIDGFYPKKYYEHYDKLLYELIPLINIQKRLFNIADAGIGL